MATAMLRVLEDRTAVYGVDGDDYVQFEDGLSLWASKWVPEIGVGIAENAHELFEIRAVRMLVGKWAEMERKDAEAYKAAFEHAASGDDVGADDFRGIGTQEKAGISDALRLLIVQ